MVAKDTKKKTKLTKREPTSASILKKVATVSDSNKTLQKEIKIMTKIFGENQKVLISMKNMIDSLTSTLENIQKQSKQINMLEEDAQKLYAGLNQVRTQSDLVTKINNQTEKLEEEINKINDLQKSSPKIKDVSQQVEDSINSIRNNSQMIIKIAQRIDEVKEDLNKVSGKTDSFLDVRKNIEELNKNIHAIQDRTEKIGDSSKVVSNLKEEFEKIMNTVKTMEETKKELTEIKNSIDIISLKASRTDAFEGVIENMKQQFETVFTKIESSDDISESTIREIGGKIDKIETEINTLTQRADEVKEDLNKVSGKTDSFLDVRKNIEELNKNIHAIQDRTEKIGDSSKVVSNLKEEFEKIMNTVKTMEETKKELTEIKNSIDIISLKASRTDAFEGVIENMKQQFETVFTKIESSDDISESTIREIGGKIDKIETEINTLTQRADTTAFVGEGLKSIQDDVASFKKNVYDKTNSIDQKISSVNETLKRQDISTSEFHKKSDKLFEEIQHIKNRTDVISDNSSKEMMALLQLSKYQSNVRMLSESKYGSIKDLENIATQTSDIGDLFTKLESESNEPAALPHEVLQWAITKILECADKWEIRFSDLFATLRNILGRDVLKNSIRIQQVRDIYGIRAVDEIRNELGIS